MRKTTKGRKPSALKLTKRILAQALASLSHDSHVVPRAKVVRDTMIVKNYGLVVHVALRHRRDDIPFDDLMGYGTEGLIRAVDGFDPKKGSKFSSYAGVCISHAISRSIAEKETLIRLPEHRAREKMEKSREETKAHVKGVEPPQSSKKKERAEPEAMLYLDRCEKVIDDNVLSPEDFVILKLKEEGRAHAIAILKGALSKDEWFILGGGFCFDTEKPLSLRKMGAVLGLCPESVNNKKRASLGKARRVLSHNRLTIENFF